MHETIWGGKRLNCYVSDKNRKIGHLYTVNGHRNMSNIILNGPDKGNTLHKIFEQNRYKWDLSKYDEFPLTIALVDATENLSIQVHPDDETAELLESRRIGKKESWLFLEQPDDGWIYGGCRCNTIEEVKEMLKKDKIQEITARLPIRKYDCACVEAGTLHAMTSGSLVYEIEYGSDYTYRFFDYDRKDANGQKRELHIDKAIHSIKPQKVPQVIRSKEEEWIYEDVYGICRKKDVSKYRNSGEEIECITVLNGEGNIENIRLKGGMSILLMPGEKIKDVNFEDMIVARLIR
ncbi:MAG: hypothetical protein HFG99_01140 [Dorea sp.]|nr:hypothetical protein [Dorea sp.]MCI9247750.1 hypothetical protein [Dorea sp.]